MVKDVSMYIGTDVRIQEPGLPILDKPIRIFEIGLTRTYRLNLCSAQGNSRFILLAQEVIVSSRAIHGGIAFAGSDRVPLYIPWFFRANLIWRPACHIDLTRVWTNENRNTTSVETRLGAAAQCYNHRL